LTTPVRDVGATGYDLQMKGQLTERYCVVAQSMRHAPTFSVSPRA
jgi:hypothetical protein